MILSKFKRLARLHNDDPDASGGGFADDAPPDAPQDHPDLDAPADDGATDQAEEEGDDLVVTFGDDAPPADEDQQQEAAPSWVKELRKSQRELQRENRELKAKLTASTQPADQAPQLGPKPTLEAADWDADKYEADLMRWHDQKRKVEAHAEKQHAEAQAQQAAWQEKLAAYQTAKSAIKAADFEDAEHAATEIFSVTQQGLLLQGAENSARLIYALGKHPAKAKELAAITDPVRFAWKAAQLEKDMKMTSRKAPPPPEKSIRGTAPVSGTVDSVLERLRADAEKTGDLSKVIAYKRQLKGRS